MINKINRHHSSWVFILFVSLTSFSARSNTIIDFNESKTPRENQNIGKLLPFEVCNVFNNHAFQNGYSLIDAGIKVYGGNSNDWVATGIAVSKVIGSLGLATDVRLQVFRSDLDGWGGKNKRVGYKLLVNIDYGVNPDHSMNTSNGSEQWSIGYATDSSVVTARDIEIANYYDDLMSKNNNPWNDDAVVAKVKKKYKISGEFSFPSVNVVKSSSNPNDYYIVTNDNDKEFFNLVDIVKGVPENSSEKNIECSTND